MVIQQALREPRVFVFGELLAEPNVQELEGTEFKPWLDLLKVFAYGTYADYKSTDDGIQLYSFLWSAASAADCAVSSLCSFFLCLLAILSLSTENKAQLPEVKDQMLTKLKLLTIVTHASQHKVLPYDLLLKELDLTNVRELEDMIIDCIYEGLIKGKLDQRRGALIVHSTIGRDISPADIDVMLNKLSSWLETSKVLISNLEKQIAAANEAKAKEKAAEEALEKERKDMIEALKAAKQEGHEGGAAAPSGLSLHGMLGNLAQMAGFDVEGRRSRRRGHDPYEREGGFGFFGRRA